MRDSLRTIVFSAVLGVVCAGLLTAASQVLRPYQEANRQAERWRNILAVLEVQFDRGASSEELLRIAGRTVRQRRAGGLTWYEFDHPQAGRLRAFEFAGPGLWGPVEGLLCLRGDLKTIFAISFYKHEETPGLGGEIASESFRRQFAGKLAGESGIRIIRGKAQGPHQIDGISGATLTCDKLQSMLNALLDRIGRDRQAILEEAGHGG